MTEVRHRYEARGAARTLFTSRADEVLLSGPAGTGKSRACLEKMHLCCMKYPGTTALIVRKTATSLTSTGLQTYQKHVALEALTYGIVSFYGGSDREPSQFRYSNGSRIFLGGMDKATKIMSSEYDLIFVQEATELTITDWEHLLTRLGRVTAMPYAQIMADCNPDAPTHWLKKRCNDGSTKMLLSQHADNPILYTPVGEFTEQGRKYVEDKLGALTGVRRKRLLDGLWVAAEGMIYEEQWSEEHIVDAFDVPDDWRRLWSVDFGFVHPLVIQCWAINPDGVMYLYREMVHTRRTVLTHAKQLMNIVAPGSEWDTDGHLVKEGEWIEPRPDRVVTDHDAEDRETLEYALGMGTTSADKRVKVGIDTVQEVMAAGRIKIMRGCVVERDLRMEDVGSPIGFAEEVVAYVWNTGGGRTAKEEPVKDRDDAMDAGRYAVMENMGSYSPGVRWL